MPIPSSYRPHNPGHDYYAPGVYLVTLVVGNRDRLLSSLNMDMKSPNVQMTELGEFLHNQWEKSVILQEKHGNKIKILSQVCMPDHWHGVIEVEDNMSWNLGDIVQAVKAACTSHWRKSIGFVEPPISAQMIRHMSHEERRLYYASIPRNQRSLFDDDYDDTICFPKLKDQVEHERHKAAMINYVNDNPRRAIVMKTYPQFFERRLHIALKVKDLEGNIITRDYAAFGNIYLLRWARKVQVMCHRKARFSMLTEEEKTANGIHFQALPNAVTGIPYIETQAYRTQHDELIAQVMAGATVVVTPGISAGEKAVKEECLAKGIPLIHLQKEPIGMLWKPEKERFTACQNGMLLILAPWHPDKLECVNGVPQDTEYSIFHNLNALAHEICEWNGESVVKR